MVKYYFDSVNSKFLLTLIIALSPILGFSTGDDPNLYRKVNSFIAESNHLGFQENKGQVADDEGVAAPYVLFKTHVPNLNLWVTNTGLTYQFMRLTGDEIPKDVNGK